jgi:hypothetical protein
MQGRAHSSGAAFLFRTHKGSYNTPSCSQAAWDLRRVLEQYLDYYHQSRTHRALAQDCPVPRPVMTPDQESVVEFPLVGGLHHLYTRQAA